LQRSRDTRPVNYNTVINYIPSMPAFQGFG
jgi:hypothetical protein